MPAGVIPILEGELRVINTDPYHQREKGLVPVPILRERSCGFIPTSWQANSGLLLLIGSPGAKQKLCLAMWCVLPPSKQKLMSPLLTYSEEEIIVVATELNAPLVARTRSGQSYLKKYDEMVACPPKSIPKTAKPSTKQPVEKYKEIRYAKALRRTKRKDLQHLTALISWLNWPISRLGSPFTSS